MRLRLGAALAAPFAVLWLIAMPAMAQKGQKQQPPAAVPTDGVKPSATSIPSDASPAAVDPKTFAIGTEDIIRVMVWMNPDLSGNHTVRPDGKIAMPLIGELQAAGLTPDRLRAQITQALSEQIIKPEVTVEVMQVNSRKFYLTGEVTKTGMFPLIGEIKVFDALSMAGGFRDFAKKGDVLILRKDGQVFHFNWNEFVKGKHREKNIPLENGDTIVVK
jgi:polysaccharide export outer membrane protein